METKLISDLGLAVDETEYKVVKKAVAKGGTIEKHNHPEAKVIFTVVKGAIDVCINDEHFNAVPGTIINFDGDNYLSADILEDAEIFITLVNKQ